MATQNSLIANEYFASNTMRCDFTLISASQLTMPDSQYRPGLQELAFNCFTEIDSLCELWMAWASKSTNFQPRVCPEIIWQKKTIYTFTQLKLRWMWNAFCAHMTPEIRSLVRFYCHRIKSSRYSIKLSMKIECWVAHFTICSIRRLNRFRLRLYHLAANGNG